VTSALLLHLAFAAGFPVYSDENIVNAANNRTGPLAPNTIASIYGSDLSFGNGQAPPGAGTTLPVVLQGTRVFVGNIPAHLYFVSPKQINFLVPSSLLSGQHNLYVSSEGRQGPLLRITVADFTPAPFVLPDDWVAATKQDGSALTPDSPAQAGDIVVIYATGLGATNPSFPAGMMPGIIAPIVRRPMRVQIGSAEIAPESIFYAGITPGFAGLYQINIRVPELPEPDPEIILGESQEGAAPGPKLPYQPPIQSQRAEPILRLH
jgi:uncharacterized protein (TIGR03437 family)